MCATRSCTDFDRRRTVVPVHKIMNSLSSEAKMMRDILYRRPRLEHANKLGFLDLLNDKPSLNASVL